MDSCTFCNACVVACPFAAITMNGKFESAVYDRSLLVFALNTYAGPPAKALMKIEDPEERKKLIEPCTPYSGHTMLDEQAAQRPPRQGRAEPCACPAFSGVAEGEIPAPATQGGREPGTGGK